MPTWTKLVQIVNIILSRVEERFSNMTPNCSFQPDPCCLTCPFVSALSFCLEPFSFGNLTCPFVLKSFPFRSNAVILFLSDNNLFVFRFNPIFSLQRN